MECPYCKQELKVPPYAINNTLIYGSVAHVRTMCCQKPIALHRVQSIKYTKDYTTNLKDDWGEPYDHRHILFEDHDEGVPDCIKDRNGEVCLGMCRLCGAGEQDLLDYPTCDLYRTRQQKIEDEEEDRKASNDPRFRCPKCGSTNVGLRPMFGSTSVCRDCKHAWSNPC